MTTDRGAPGATILVVDDELAIRRAMEVTLEALGHQVVTAATGEEALTATAKHHPDLVVLDLGLPGISGHEVIVALRGWSHVPIVVLSARDNDAEKVEALDAGADDYVTKPFSMDELLARIRSALRRGRQAADVAGTEAPVITTADFTIDLALTRVTRDGEEIRLTPTEWHLVEMLVRNRGRLVTQRQLLQEVWGPGYGEETNYLRVFMAQIRAKLERDSAHPRYFHTETGMGYRFEDRGA